MNVVLLQLKSTVMSDNKKLILNVFAGLQDALFLGDRFSNGEFVSFLQPGQFVSPNLKQSDNSKDLAIQAEIANILVDSSYVNKYKDIDYSGGTELIGSVDQVYSDILKHAALPHAVLSASTLKEIKDLDIWLAANKSNYELYRDQYFDVVEAYYTESHKQTPNGAILQRLAQKKKDAYATWENFGNKRLYDIKRGRYVYLTSEDPQSFWLRLAERLQDHAQRAPQLGDYFQTLLVPSISSWNTAGWATFERQISEKDSYEYSKSTSWSGGLSARWGLFSVGGGSSGSTNYRYEKSTVDTVNLKFEYLRVRIHRPWLVSDVFGYNFWTWNKAFGGQYISDGGNLQIDPPIRPIGRMPILPQYLIVVRNLELSAAFSQDERDFYSREVQHKASFGWGPFSLSGSYREAESSKHVHASFDGITFRIEQPQIIARSGIMLQKSPNPNKSLSWEDDACFPGEDCFSTQAEIISTLRSDDLQISYEEEKAILSEKEAEEVRDPWLANRLRS